MKTLRLGSGNYSLTIVSDDKPEPLRWRVILRSGGLSASTDIDLDSFRHTRPTIGQFFAALAADWRGWSGERTWRTSPLDFAATHDGLGHIAIAVDLRPNVFSEPDWEARATVDLEAGELDHVAREAAALPPLWREA